MTENDAATLSRPKLRARGLGFATLVWALMMTLNPAPAAGDPPLRDRLTFNQTEVDWDLSEACGVTVTTTQQGRVTWTVHGESWEPGLILTINVAIAWTYAAGDDEYRTREARVSKMQLRPDGTLIAMGAGNSGLFQSGITKGDFYAGQIFMYKGGGSTDWSRVCEALTA